MHDFNKVYNSQFTGVCGINAQEEKKNLNDMFLVDFCFKQLNYFHSLCFFSKLICAGVCTFWTL